MTARKAAEHVQHALRYLENFERAARLRNDRSGYFHFEQCWRTVHEAFYGVFTVPRYILPEVPTKKPAAWVSPAKQDRPKWFRQVQSRPLRKVIESYRKRDATVYVLECGHDVTEIGSVPGDKGLRRRCKKCAPVRKRA